MRIAILSDIHGNSIALDAVLEDIRAQGGVDAYWVLGDLAAIGGDPVGVLERVAALPAAHVIRGNTDRFLVTGERPAPTPEQCQANPELWLACLEVANSFAWTQGMVTGAGWVDWLAGLPLESRMALPDGTRVLRVHASPGHDDGPSVHPGVSQAALSSLVAECEADLVLVGHTHWPMELRVAGVHLVNVGSVSNPLPPDLRASYMILEADEAAHRLQHRQVAYDRAAVVAELQRVHHPAAEYISRYMRGEHYPYWMKASK